MIIGHVANIARIQVNWDAGYILVILLSIFNTAGRLVGGGLSDKIGRIGALRIVFALQTANMLLFSFYNSYFLIGVGASLAGLCYGAGFSIFPATIIDKFGQKNFGSNYGVIFTAWGVGGIIGPMAGAAILDATGSYYGAYMVAGVLMIITLLIAFAFKSQAKIEGTVDEDTSAVPSSVSK